MTTTRTTTADHLATIARTWPDLREHLATPTLVGGFGRGIRAFLATVVDDERAEYDAHQRAHLRSLERSTAQLGERPVPLNLRVFQAMHDIETALLDTADQIAAANQRAAVAPAGPNWRTLTDAPGRREWTPADRARRDTLAAQDATDPQRWQLLGHRTAPQAALWLCARVHGIRWPGSALSDEQHTAVARVAASAVHRIETVLDTDDEQHKVIEQPCACGGRIEITGGAGTRPVARCQACRAIWSEAGIIAS
ncbi:hypothetical protein [Streptomyces sp. NPDC060194]|uniref:hypothetical protein n=1 Tax=Streptomyces sp. NPDC060194 TaxID=3347069 RepID=UPI00365A83DC